MEVAVERIGFLEQKLKEQSEEHHEDNQRLMEIISKSKDIFKNIFDAKETDTSDALDTTVGTNLDTTVGSQLKET